jgi:hypothetical protein
MLDRAENMENFKKAEEFHIEKIKDNLILLSLNLINEGIDNKISVPKSLE